MNEDAAQLFAEWWQSTSLEPVIRERRREWRMLHDLTDGPLAPTRIAELVEHTEEGEKLLGYIERSARMRPNLMLTVTFAGYVAGVDAPVGPSQQWAATCEEAFAGAQRDVEEALAALSSRAV